MRGQPVSVMKDDIGCITFSSPGFPFEMVRKAQPPDITEVPTCLMKRFQTQQVQSLLPVILGYLILNVHYKFIADILKVDMIQTQYLEGTGWQE